MKSLFRKKAFSEVDQLKLFTLIAIALDANNENIKHLFKISRLMSQYVEAKQAEGRAVIDSLKEQNDLLLDVDYDLDKLTRRVAKLDGKKSKRKNSMGTK